MKDLRRNEFIDMLEMAELLYQQNDKFIKCDIPNFGGITYYPKADKLQIDKTNDWRENGFNYGKFLIKEHQILKLQSIESTSLVEIKEEKSDADLRNEFAGLAMQSLISRSKDLLLPDYIAEKAFNYADAMVKRSKL